ncbi:hypothetical protein OS493_019260 [Desmophyllum pertusum]|uniref:Uncharacterized protein n=1 Tax=Desmophyllum pertusum TaxID=174260 RepID=A0A9W9YBP1_9CNID|nr:hypothetical protein OS493_019260 [Desmophyllum pertusum]
MTRLQVVEVDHSPLTTLSRLASLLLNAIGNIRQGLYDPPGTTPMLKELIPTDPCSVSVPHPVSRMEPLTIALYVITGFLRFMCSLEIPHSHFPCGADGSGFSDNTLCCYKAIYEAAPLVSDAIKLASVKPGSVFTIADYGCADGGNSMPLLYACVQELRKIHGDDFSINVIYEDQPVNDFKPLFLRLQGLMPGPTSYFLNFPDVFVTACGTNFFSQCFPPQTVNLAFSATAFHWFSRKPCDITGALHHTMITIPEEAEVFEKQAAKDWETILLNRAKELAPGSRMILVQLAIDKEGQYVGTTKGTRFSLHHMLSELWKGLATDGLITQNEFHKTTFAHFFRTENEFKKPFESKDSPVRKAGLSLISIETKVVPCPYREKWLKNGGDPKEHAHWYIPAIRAWSNTTFVSGLSDSRSSEEKERIVDELFQRYENEVAKFPEDHGVDFVSAYMVIGKSN